MNRGITIKFCKRPSAQPFHAGTLSPAPENYAELLDAALALFDAYMRTNVYSPASFARVAVTVVLKTGRITLARLNPQEFVLSPGAGARTEDREVPVVVTGLREETARHTLGGAFVASLERHTEALRRWLNPEGRVAIATFAHRCGGVDADIAAVLLRDTVSLFRAALSRPLEKAEMSYVSKNVHRFFGQSETFKMVDVFLPTWLDGAADACGKVPFFTRLANRVDLDPSSAAATAKEVHDAACTKFDVFLSNMAVTLERGLHRRPAPCGGEKSPPLDAGVAQKSASLAASDAGAPPASSQLAPAPPPALKSEVMIAREMTTKLADVEAVIAEAMRAPCQTLVGRLVDLLLREGDARVVFLGDVAMLDEDIKLVRADVYTESTRWLPEFIARCDFGVDFTRSRPHNLVERVCADVGGRAVAIVNVLGAAHAPRRVAQKSAAYLQCVAPFLITESRDRVVARCVADMLCLAHECHGGERRENLVKLRLLYRALRLFCERSRLKITVKGKKRTKIFFRDFDSRLCAPEGGTPPNALRDIPFSGKMGDGSVLCDLKHPEAVNTFAHGPAWERLMLMA